MQTARIASLSRPPARVHARRERRRGPVRVLAAGGKRDGRGSETWKDGRSDTFDASGKDAILIGKGLRKTHDGERYQFRNVDISLNSGQRVAVVGPNGSGKSTLLQVLAGKEAGREDGDVHDRRPAARRRRRRGVVGRRRRQEALDEGGVAAVRRPVQ